MMKKTLLIGALGLCALGARAQDYPVAAGAQLEKLAGGFAFTEGPAADAGGNVYFTDQPNDRILKWSTAGELSVFQQGTGRANGLWIDPEGNILAASDDRNELRKISPDGSHEVLVDNVEGKLLNGPNDVWQAPGGDIYFTDPLYPRDYWTRSPERQPPGEYVYRLPAGGGEIVPVATDLVKPNGIVGTPDGRHLYVADIGAGKTWRYTVAPDGSLAEKTLFADEGSDGMTLDSDGNVYLTARGVIVFNPSGERLARIAVPEGWTANVTFGGADRRTLFITASTGLYAIRMQTQGVK